MYRSIVRLTLATFVTGGTIWWLSNLPNGTDTSLFYSGIIYTFTILILVRELRPLLNGIEKLLQLQQSQRYGLDHIFLNLPPQPVEWMNLGYWKGLNASEDFLPACEATATVLATEIDLLNAKTVIDVGFGCADQDFFFLDKFKVSKIIGFNSSKDQVDRAALKCKKLDENRFEPKFGIAPFLPVEPDSADIVLSLDSAYHYNTRFQFLQNSCSWLKRGGKIGLVDLVLNEPTTLLSWPLLATFAWIIGIPLSNLYDTHSYRKKMEEAGFSRIKILTLDPNAFSHLPCFINSQLERYRPILSPSVINKYSMTSKGMEFLAKHQIFQFALVTATKL